jgi:hypothetical protein
MATFEYDDDVFKLCITSDESIDLLSNAYLGSGEKYR